MTHFCSTDNGSQYTKSAGFTLVEVVIAIAIISIIMTAVYGIFTTISATQQRLEEEADIYHQARVIFTLLGRELRSCYLNNNDKRSAFFTADDGDGNNYLTFTTTSAVLSGNAPGGLVRVRYQLDEQNNRLLRSATPVYVPDSARTTQRLSSDITQVSWRFFDGSAWQDSWDSNISYKLPQTVEISMAVQCGGRKIDVLSAFDLAQKMGAL